MKWTNEKRVKSGKSLETAKNNPINQKTMGTHPQTTNTPIFMPLKSQKTYKIRDKTGKNTKNMGNHQKQPHQPKNTQKSNQTTNKNIFTPLQYTFLQNLR